MTATWSTARGTGPRRRALFRRSATLVTTARGRIAGGFHRCGHRCPAARNSLLFHDSDGCAADRSLVSVAEVLPGRTVRVLASRWMLSRTRAPGLSSVPPRPRQPRPPAPRSANPARTCPPRTAGGNVTDDDSDRVLGHLNAALVGRDWMGLQHVTSGPSDLRTLVWLDDAGCRPAGGAGPGESSAALRRAVRGRRAHLGSSAVRAAEKPPPVAQRQRRQQVDRIRLGDRHERGRVRTVRVRRADCRRSPRATRAFLRIPAPTPAANRGRTLRRGPDIRDRGSDPGPGSSGGGRCRPRAATTAGPGCPRSARATR